MEKEKVIEIVKNHLQMYESTCTPSAVEMILKLEGKVDLSYYELQNDTSFRNGANYREVTGDRFGLKFIHKFSFERNREFPIDKLFNEIESNLKFGRYVAISLFQGVSPDGYYEFYHNYIIFNNQKNEFQAITRYYNDTNPTIVENVKKKVIDMNGTDILVYEKINPEMIK